MKVWFRSTIGVVATSVLAACGGGGSSDAPSTPALSEAGAAFKSLNSAIDSAGGMIPNTVDSSSLAKYLKEISTFALTNEAVWNMTTLVPDPRCSGDENGNGLKDDPYCDSAPNPGVPAAEDLAVREIVGFLSDPNAVRGNGSSISAFGRVKTALTTPCAIATILGSEGGAIPTSSEQRTVVFTSAHIAAVQSACETDISDKVGATLTAQFEPTTDKTYYDTKLTITMGGDSIVNYLRLTNAAVSVSTVENNTEGTRTGSYRTFVYLDRVTGALSAEYLSFSADTSDITRETGEFHRLYVNKAEGEGVMISGNIVKQADLANKYANTQIFGLIGNPGNAASNTGFAFIRAGDGNLEDKDSGPGDGDVDYSSGAILFDFTGCAKQSDGTFVHSDITTCAGAGATGVGTTLKQKLATLIDSIEVSKVTASSVTGETGGIKFADSAAVMTTPIALGN